MIAWAQASNVDHWCPGMGDLTSLATATPPVLSPATVPDLIEAVTAPGDCSGVPVGPRCPAGAAVIESLLQQRRRTAALAYAPQVPGRAWTASKQVLQPNSELTASSPAGRGAQTRTGDLLLPKQALPTFVVRIGFLEFAWTTCFAIPAPDQHLLQRSGAVPEAIRSCPRQPAPIQPYHSS